MTTQPRSRPPRSRTAAQRSRLNDQYDREIDRLAADFHARLPREQARSVGAIYARYSSRLQDSIADQVRSLFEFALAERIFVPRHLVFFDAAVRGAKSRRPGLDRLRLILESKAIEVLLVFSTNRLSRKMFRAMQFVEEEIVERGIRCVFVKDGLDTADGNRWRFPLQVHAITDEMVGGMYAENIRAAHEGLFDRDLVCGTITFGYRGRELPEQPSRRQRTRRALAIDPATAPWVERAFRWYADDRLSIGAIVRRFNGDPKIPPSPRGGDGRWSREAIRYLLANPRYRGWWEYGARENVFQSKRDYTRRVPRDQPLRSRQSEDLRIVSDELWYRVQRRLTRPDRSGVGRKPRGGEAGSRPRLIHGLFVCPAHDQILYAGGSYGRTLYCKTCSELPEAERPLYSHLPRALALSLTCRKLAELVRQDSRLVEASIDACRRAADDLQRPDPHRLEALETRIGALERQIRFIMENAGDTEDDRRESGIQLDAHRRRRAELKSELASLEAALARPAIVPSEAEVRALLARFEGILTAAADREDEEEGQVRQVIDLLTGGRIELFQCGEPRSHGGWLRGRFRAHLLDGLVRALADVAGGEGQDEPVITIDYRQPTPSEAWADRVKELYDRGMLIKAIAAALGITRNLASKALGCWYQREGLARTDGRSRRSTLEDKHLEPPLFVKLSEEAMELHDEGHTYEEIADRLKCSRPTVAKAIRHWHRSRGLPEPAGRRGPEGSDRGRSRPESQGTGGLDAHPAA